MAISAGRAVISDNGGHFHPVGVDDEPHYGGHMWRRAGSDDA